MNKTYIAKRIATIMAIFLAACMIFIAGKILVSEIQSISSGNGFRPLSEIIYIGNDQNNLKRTVKLVRSQNPYMQVLVGPDTYLHAIYNDKGEAFVESEATGVVGVYKNNHELVVVSNTESEEESSISFITDLDPLSFIEAACDAVGKNGATISKEKQDNDYDKYTIKIVGKDAIKSVYMQTGDEQYANDSMDMLFNSVEEDVSDNAYLIIRVICSNGNSDGTGVVFGATCNMSFDGTEDGEYTSWAFDGYVSIPDWELGENWYNTPETDSDAWAELYQTTVESMASSLMEFMYSNDMLATDAETSAVTAEQFIESDEDTQFRLIQTAMNDVENYGAHISGSETDLYEAIKQYYNEAGDSGINLFQAVINIAMDKGWLIQDMVDGEQSGTDTSSNGDN